LSYQNGSIWPHDNWLIAKGLKQYGYYQAALAVTDRLFNAAKFFPENRLPELYAALPSGTLLPYPRASSPQAWASGAPLALLHTLLGFKADKLCQTVTFDSPMLPQGFAALDLDNIPLGYGKTLNVHVEPLPNSPWARVFLKGNSTPGIQVYQYGNKYEYR
jgi:glycogen debranching enzyme